MTRTGLLVVHRLLVGQPLRPAIQSALLHCASTSHKLSTTQRTCWSTSRAVLSSELVQLARRRQASFLLQSKCFSSKSDDHDFASQLIHESREGSNPLQRADRKSTTESQAKKASASESSSSDQKKKKSPFSSSPSEPAESLLSASSLTDVSKSASFSLKPEVSKSKESKESKESAESAEEKETSDGLETMRKSGPITNDLLAMHAKVEKVIKEPLILGGGTEKAFGELSKKLEELKPIEEEGSERSKKTEGEGAPKIEDDPKDLDEKRKRLEKTNRNTMRAFVVFATIIVVGSACFIIYYAIPDRDNSGNWIQDEFSSYPIPLSNLYRVLHHVNLWKDYVKEPSREDLLPPPLPAPYIQPKYTLVIELKNVLLAPEWSYSTGWRFKKRPAIEYFLDTVGYPNFEVVIYTSEPPMTAEPLVNSLDSKQRIMYRCYRDCTKYMKGHHVKDLVKLRRDMSKVIMMDHDPKSFQLNPENALRIPPWNGDMDDTSLIDLAELLKTIYLSDVDDVRPTLQYYSQFDDPAKEFRRRATFLAQQELENKKQTESNYSMVKNYAGRLFGYRRHS